MSLPAETNLEQFSRGASEHLLFLMEYAGVLLDTYPAPDVVERLCQSAEMLAGNSDEYGLPLFSEIAGKLAHIFHYALSTGIGPESSAAIVEFIQEAATLLESDLLLLNANGIETSDDIQAFKAKHPFAFQAAAPEASPAAPETSSEEASQETAPQMQDDAPAGSLAGGASDECQTAASETLPDDGEVPTEIIEFFLPEAEEHLQVVTECLLALEANASPEIVHRLFRAMHTVKGSAAQVGLHRIAHVAHRAEDLVGRLRDGALQPSAEIVDICLEAVDVLKKFLYHHWADERTMQTSVGSLLARIASLVPAEEEEERSAPQQPAGEVALAAAPVGEAAGETSAPIEPDLAVPQSVASVAEDEPVASAESATIESSLVASSEPLGLEPQAPSNEPSEFSVPSETSPPPAKELATVSQSKSVRVPLDRLDRMMNSVGSLVINRTRMLGRLGELEHLAEVLNFSKARLIEKIGEFQERYEFTHMNGNFGALPSRFPASGTTRFPLPVPYRDSAQAEFSELEWDRYDDFNILSRSLTEISADLTEVLTQLGRFVRQVNTDMDEFAKLAHHLQDEITEARMVPIGNLYTRLSRTARDAAKAAGKQVELALAGAETDLDNGIIQLISDPLIQLVRNAVAHGVETPEERAECGKPAQGHVALRAYHRGNQIFIAVEDDGRGIDYEKIRSAAQTLGILSADAAMRLTERELLELLFRPGFSTASRKTELAGRGVGLDVVRSNVTALNGEITVETQKGMGTRFTLKVPLTLIITQALFLRHGAWVFGIPLACVEEIRRLRPSEIEDVGGKLLTRVRGEVMEVVRLDTRLGLEPVEPASGYLRLVIVNVGGRQMGIVVEEVLRKDEIVIKGLGEYLRNVKLFSGATIAPDGSLILLLDVSRLVAADAPERSLAFAGDIAANSLAAASPVVDAAPRAKTPDEKVVLLADDSISVRRFVGRMLEKAGYRVKLACDGLEALEIATQGGCNLVVTDLEMPRTNGYELMAHLRQNASTRGLPVIVLTSRAGDKHRDRALQGGAAGFLSKPVQEEQLIATVARFLGRAGEQVTPEPEPAEVLS